MLRSSNGIKGYALEAIDGEIGKTKDFLFDDQCWAVRYLVADTASWLIGRKVLISPISLGHANDRKKSIGVRLSKEQIKDSPPLDSDKPVSRQYEEQFLRFFGWPVYWQGAYAWGPSSYPGDLYQDPEKADTDEAVNESENDKHLRSINEVRKYHIKATDGEIGHVDDFVVDDDDWIIRYLIVDTHNLLPSRKVLINTAWTKGINYDDSTISAELTREEVKNSPEFRPSKPIDRDYEILIHNYYGRRFYW